jgi:hypothetical protein
VDGGKDGDRDVHCLVKQSKPSIEDNASKAFLGLNEGETPYCVGPPFWAGAPDFLSNLFHPFFMSSG